MEDGRCELHLPLEGLRESLSGKDRLLISKLCQSCTIIGSAN